MSRLLSRRFARRVAGAAALPAAALRTAALPAVAVLSPVALCGVLAAACDRAGGRPAAVAAAFASEDARPTEELRREFLEGTLPAPAPAAASTGGRREAGNAKTPELPRATVDTRVPAAVAGAHTFRPTTSAQLQDALDRARPGDVVLLRGGAQYAGNFVLRRYARTSGPGWVTLRTDGPGVAAGTRVTPESARGFARLVTPNGDPVLSTEPGAHHYRVEAVELTTKPDAAPMVALVRFGDAGADQRTLAQLPHHLVLAHVYAHGQPRVDLRRCIDLDGATSAVVDSYVTDCHSNNTDSQAIFGSNGPGPFTIVNNTLEGSGENIMFGGSDPMSPELVPSDITIRGNHVRKPMAWKDRWQAKNLLELKVGRRVLVEGNVFENSWPSGQIGFAVVLWSVNQDGRATYSETSDVTFQYNVVRNAANGFQLTDGDDWSKTVPMHRVLIRHNLVLAIGTNRALGFGGGRAFQVNGRIADLAIVHNTNAGLAGPWVYFVSPPNTRLDRLTILDNAVDQADPTMRCDTGNGNDALLTYAGPGTVMRNNALGGWYGPRVPDNFYLMNGERLFDVVGVANGDFRLPSKSPYRRAATDRTDIGADVAAVDSATRGVVLPDESRR